MQGSGLNFQQGHFTDPLASMQASLGAGSMFAKTLSNMQQFDQDEAKLQMMRQDRERQAKLDAEHEADRAKLAKTAADNTEYRRFMAKSDSTYDATDSFNQLEKEGGDKLANILYNKDGKHQAESDKAQADLANKIVSQSEEAQKQGSIYQKSDFKKHHDFLTSKGGIDNVGDDIIDAGRKIDLSANEASAKIQEKMDLLESQRQTAIQNGSEKDLNNQLKLLEFQKSGLNNDESDAIKIAKALNGGLHGGSKAVWSEDFNKIAAQYKNQFRNAPDPFKAQLDADIEKARTAGALPGQLSNYLAGTTSQSKKGDADNFDSYVYKTGNSNLLKRDNDAYNKLYGGSNESSNTAIYEDNRKARDKLQAEYARVLKAEGAGNDAVLAGINEKMARLDRSPDQLVHDEQHKSWKGFLTDHLDGYKDPNSLIAEKQGNGNGWKIPETETAAGSKVINKDPTKQAPVSNIQTGNRMFDLDPTIKKAYADGDKKAYNQMMLGNTIKSISVNEGTVGDGNHIYKVAGIPHVGIGLKLSEFDSWLKSKGGSSYESGFNNPATKQKYIDLKDQYQQKRFEDAHIEAQKIAKDNGLSAEATPILANAVFQLGNGFSKAFAPTLKEIKDGNFSTAADHIRSTKWIKQTPDRAQQFIAMLNDQATRKGTSHYSESFNKLDEKLGYIQNKAYDDMYKENLKNLQSSISASNKFNVDNPSHARSILEYRSDADTPTTFGFNGNTAYNAGVALGHGFINTHNFVNDYKRNLQQIDKDAASSMISDAVALKELKTDVLRKAGKLDEYSSAKTKAQKDKIYNQAKIDEEIKKTNEELQAKLNSKA